jgi:Mrp family chromosome partitioning ATPase
MANSLNQAFIQAFKKSSPTGSAGLSSDRKDTAELANQDLVVRLDTATMTIPQPHFTQTAIRAQKNAGKKRTLRQTATSENSEEIRDSIADEMLRASGIGEENETGLDLGDSSFDTFTTNQPPLAIPPTSKLQPVSSPAATSTAVPESVEQPSELAQTPSSGAIFEPQPSLDTHQEHVATHTPAEVANQPAPAQIADTVQAAAPALEPPAEPALSPTDVERIVDSYVRKHGKPGDILRLDTPNPQISEVQADSSKSVQQSDFRLEEDLEPLSTHDQIEESAGAGLGIEQEDQTQSETLATEADGPILGVQSKHTIVSEAAAAEAIAAEENLRRAKMRSFTPVWEVDHLHWPLVCESLLAECQDSLMDVAINLSKASEEGLQVLAVTSPEAGNGRSTVSCCLAQIAGAAGLRVAIVDGDIENPSLSYQTNLDVDQDWKTAILTEMPLEEVAVHSIEDQVTLIPLLEPIHDFEMDEHDNRIAFMLQQLSESFDLVLVDMGHMDSKRTLVTAMAEQGILSAVLTVVDPHKTTPQKIEACIRRIRRTGITSVGIVENFAT